MTVQVHWIDTVPSEVIARTSQQESCRQNVIHELIETEGQYVRDLQFIIHVFYKPLLINKILSKEELEAGFLNLEAVYEASLRFFDALKDRQQESLSRNDYVVKNIGDVMLSHARSLFVHYQTYCEAQITRRNIEELRRMSLTNPRFAQFLSTARKDPRCTSIDLYHELVKPMQRCTKYPLLLRSILAFTPENHSDFQNIREALIYIEKQVWCINETIRSHENRTRLRSLYGQLRYPVGLEPRPLDEQVDRKLIFDGILRWCCRNAIVDVHLYLFSDGLLITRTLKGEPNVFYAIKHLSLEEVSFQDMPDASFNCFFGFQLVHQANGGRCFQFQTLSYRDKGAWKEKLSSIVKKCDVDVISYPLPEEQDFPNVDKRKQWLPVAKWPCAGMTVRSRAPPPTPLLTKTALSIPNQMSEEHNQEICNTPTESGLRDSQVSHDAIASISTFKRVPMEPTMPSQEGRQSSAASNNHTMEDDSIPPIQPKGFTNRMKKFFSSPNLMRIQPPKTTNDMEPTDTMHSSCLPLGDSEIPILENNTPVFPTAKGLLIPNGESNLQNTPETSDEVVGYSNPGSDTLVKLKKSFSLRRKSRKEDDLQETVAQLHLEVQTLRAELKEMQRSHAMWSAKYDDLLSAISDMKMMELQSKKENMHDHIYVYLKDHPDELSKIISTQLRSILEPLTSSGMGVSQQRNSSPSMTTPRSTSASNATTKWVYPSTETNFSAHNEVSHQYTPLGKPIKHVSSGGMKSLPDRISLEQSTRKVSSDFPSEITNSSVFSKSSIPTSISTSHIITTDTGTKSGPTKNGLFPPSRNFSSSARNEKSAQAIRLPQFHSTLPSGESPLMTNSMLSSSQTTPSPIMESRIPRKISPLKTRNVTPLFHRSLVIEK